MKPEKTESRRAIATAEAGRPAAGAVRFADGPEPEPGSPLQHYWQILVGRRLVVLGVLLLVVGATTAGLFLRAPVYRATGMIELRQPGDDVIPVDALYHLPQISDQHLETQYALLNSAVLARRVAEEVLVAGTGRASLHSMPLHAGPTGVDAAKPPPQSGSGDEEMHAATRWIRESLSVDPLRGSRLVRVSAEADDPVLAARIVNSVFHHFASLRLEAARNAVRQLSAHEETVQARLAEAEQRLHEYVRANELVFLETAGESQNIVHRRLQTLQEEVTSAEAERFEKEARYGLLTAGAVDYLDNGVLESLNVQLAELRSEHVRLLATFTEEYPRTQQVKQQIDQLEALIEQERVRIGSRLRSDYRAAVDRERLLRSAFEEQRRAVDGMVETAAQYQSLRREVAGQLDLHADLQQKRKEAEVSAAAATTEIAVVEAAVVPESPIRPLPKRDIPLALIVGLVLGVGVAFLREHTDTAVRTAEELHTASTVPILGVIPSADRSLRGRPPKSISAGGDSPPTRNGTGGVRTGTAERHRLLVEAFGGLRTSVLFDVEKSPPRSLLVTSSQPGEGKTMVSTNLALSLAKLGRRTLLIDADTRRPAVHEAFEFDAGYGLVDFLESGGRWRELVQVDPESGLEVLPAGRRPRSPSDALSSPRMRELVDEAEDEYHFVIIDSPALLINAADTRTLAPLVDGVILVVRSGATSRELVRQVLKQTPRVIGVVLNDLDVRKFTTYYPPYDEQREETGGRRSP